MIRGPCEPCSQASSERCSELDRSREQFHSPGAAAQHAAEEHPAPPASRALLPGGRGPPPAGFGTNASFTLPIHAVRNCQAKRKLVAARDLGEASPRCAAKSRAKSSGSSARPRSARLLKDGYRSSKSKSRPTVFGRLASRRWACW